MLRSKRILRHIAFWLVYYGVYVFNELFISPSFTAHPTLDLALSAMLSQLLAMAVKVPATYTFLYWLLPLWLAAKSKFKVALTAAGLLLAFTILHRTVIQGIVWPYVYGEGAPPMTALQQTARLAYSALDLLQIIAITMSIKLFRMRLAAARKEKALIQEKLQSEIRHLKAQINPHFLFNSLNSIYALARTKSDHTPDTVMQLSKILRYVIYETSRATVSVGEEIRIMEDYIELQQRRFGKRVDLEWDLQIDHPDAQITPLLMLPLLENAYKHGAEGNPGNIRLHIHIRLQNNQLSLQTRNPISPSQPAQDSEGIGLSNIRRQLELLYQDFSLTHQEKDGSFIVNLSIDLSSYAGTQLLDR